MDFKQHKLISIAYDMYVMEDGQKILKEKAEEKSPYTFISGLGYTIDALEKKFREKISNIQELLYRVEPYEKERVEKIKSIRILSTVD